MRVKLPECTLLFLLVLVTLSPLRIQTPIVTSSGSRLSSISVPPATEWNKTYGPNILPYSMIQTDDGGYTVAGHTELGGDNGADFWLLKTDVVGNVQWNRTFGGTENEILHEVHQTSDGGYIMAGYTESFGAGQFDFWLVKTDNSGNHQWNRTYGGTNVEFASSVTETSDGGYAIAGETRSFPAHVPNAWLVKTDTDGNMEWSKVYGGTGYDRAGCIRQTPDGGYIIAGITESFTTGAWDSWLVKTDANGNMQWNKTYGGADYDGASSLVETSDGGYALAGYTKSFGLGESDIYLVKTNAIGSVEWSKTYGGAYGDEAKNIQQTGDEGYIIAGATRSSDQGPSDFWLVRTDSIGNMEWDKTFGGSNQDLAFSVRQTSDGGYALAGYTHDMHLVVWAWLIKIASEQPTDTIFIRADGSFDPPTAPVSTPDNITYILTGNVICGAFGIVVERNNIVVDGEGYTVQGTESGIGVYLSQSNNVTVKNLEIQAFYYGAYLWRSSNTTIDGNNITENTMYGLYMRNSFHNSISGNKITSNNDCGIWLDNSSSTSISMNNITGNFGDGAFFTFSKGNTILRNTVANNPIGIRVDRSLDNAFYYNSFVDNTIQVHVAGECPNNWDGSYPSGGNYWSDCFTLDLYQGPSQNETGSDGLGDTSYSIDPLNKDCYPLMYDASSDAAYPSASFTYAPSDPISGQIVVFNASDSDCPNGIIATYHWIFGDGGQGWGAVTTHIHTLYGSYNVTLTVFSNTRHSSNQTQLVTIRGKPAASFYYLPTVNATAGQSAAFDASSSNPKGGTIETYVWNFGDGNKTSTPYPVITHTFSQGKTYNTTLTVLDSEELNSSYSQLIKVWMPSLISISTNSSSTIVGFAVDINGILRDIHANGLENQTVVLYYTFVGANTWIPITSGKTDHLGKYYVNWIPPATGCFTVKVAWNGNATHFGAVNTISLSTMPYENAYVFAVESNSTVSALAFNATSLELSFTVTGETGTKGYVKVTIAESLISNIANVKAYLNGTQIDYTAVSLDDSWQIHLVCSHSTHRIVIQLSQTGWFDITRTEDLIFAIIVVAIVLAIAFLVVRRKRLKTQ